MRKFVFLAFFVGLYDSTAGGPIYRTEGPFNTAAGQTLSIFARAAPRKYAKSEKAVAWCGISRPDHIEARDYPGWGAMKALPKKERPRLYGYKNITDDDYDFGKSFTGDEDKYKGNTEHIVELQLIKHFLQSVNEVGELPNPTNGRKGVPCSPNGYLAAWLGGKSHTEDDRWMSIEFEGKKVKKRPVDFVASALPGTGYFQEEFVILDDVTNTMKSNVWSPNTIRLPHTQQKHLNSNHLTDYISTLKKAIGVYEYHLIPEIRATFKTQVLRIRDAFDEAETHLRTLKNLKTGRESTKTGKVSWRPYEELALGERWMAWIRKIQRDRKKRLEDFLVDWIEVANEKYPKKTAIGDENDEFDSSTRDEDTEEDKQTQGYIDTDLDWENWMKNDDAFIEPDTDDEDSGEESGRNYGNINILPPDDDDEPINKANKNMFEKRTGLRKPKKGSKSTEQSSKPEALTAAGKKATLKRLKLLTGAIDDILKRGAKYEGLGFDVDGDGGRQGKGKGKNRKTGTGDSEKSGTDSSSNEKEEQTVTGPVRRPNSPNRKNKGGVKDKENKNKGKQKEEDQENAEEESGTEASGSEKDVTDGSGDEESSSEAPPRRSSRVQQNEREKKEREKKKQEEDRKKKKKDEGKGENKPKKSGKITSG